MRLLLTRTARDAARTRVALEAMGHEVLISPVLDMVATSAAWPSGVVDAVLATSAQAFHMASNGPSAETKRLLPLFVVGDRTVAAARDSGFAGVLAVAPNAMALAQTIENLPNVPKRLVYLAGRDRKPDLERTLSDIGIVMDVVEVYAAESVATIDAATKVALHLGALDGVLHFSHRSAALFLDLARSNAIDITQIRHFCLSEDVAAPLWADGCTDMRIAEAPNEGALLALLEHPNTLA